MSAPPGHKTILDTDPAMGVPGRDVDDGLAIALALNSPEISVLGLTLTYGNTSLENARRSARRILHAAGRADIPAIPGAASRRDLGKPTPATDFIIRSIEAAPGEITLVPIGPLTNLAGAEMISPGILSRAKRIVCMGGAMWGRGVMPPAMTAEFNFWCDGRAADIVVRSGADFTLIPFCLTRTVIVTARRMARMSRARTPLGRYLFRNSLSWFAFSSPLALVSAGRAGFMPHDPLAVGALLWPELYEMREERVRVAHGGAHRGRIIRTPRGAPITAAHAVRESAFLDRIIQRLVEGG